MSIKKIPRRQCIGCNEQKNKKEMIRVVKIPEHEHEFVLDATGRRNGRGAYLCRSQECLDRAVKNKGLERSFKMPIPADVYEALKKEMARLG